MATYRVVTTGLPMPERIDEAWQGPKLPGGLPPQTKAASAVFFMAATRAQREPLRGFFSREIDRELKRRAADVRNGRHLLW